MQHQMGWQQLVSFQQAEEEKRRCFSYDSSLILQENIQERKKYLGRLNLQDEIKRELETTSDDKRLKETTSNLIFRQSKTIKELESQIAYWEEKYKHKDDSCKLLDELQAKHIEEKENLMRTNFQCIQTISKILQRDPGNDLTLALGNETEINQFINDRYEIMFRMNKNCQILGDMQDAEKKLAEVMQDAQCKMIEAVKFKQDKLIENIDMRENKIKALEETLSKSQETLESEIDARKQANEKLEELDKKYQEEKERLVKEQNEKQRRYDEMLELKDERDRALTLDCEIKAKSIVKRDDAIQKWEEYCSFIQQEKEKEMLIRDNEIKELEDRIMKLNEMHESQATQNGEEASSIIQEMETKHAKEKESLIKESNDVIKHLTERIKKMEMENIEAESNLMDENNIKNELEDLMEMLKIVKKEHIEEKKTLMKENDKKIQELTNMLEGSKRESIGNDEEVISTIEEMKKNYAEEKASLMEENQARVQALNDKMQALMKEKDEKLHATMEVIEMFNKNTQDLAVAFDFKEEDSLENTQKLFQEMKEKCTHLMEIKENSKKMTIEMEKIKSENDQNEARDKKIVKLEEKLWRNEQTYKTQKAILDDTEKELKNLTQLNESLLEKIQSLKNKCQKHESEKKKLQEKLELISKGNSSVKNSLVQGEMDMLQKQYQDEASLLVAKLHGFIKKLRNSKRFNRVKKDLKDDRSVIKMVKDVIKDCI